MNPPSSFPMCSRPTHRARFGLRSALLCSAALIPALGGCQAAGEDYVAPKLEVAEVEAWNGRFEGVITQEDLDPKVLAEWWTTLEDPTLTALVKDAVESNLDLRVASAQLRQARGARKVAGSAGEPQIGTSAGATRSGSSANAGPGGTNDLYSAGVDASWELDVFGGIQRQVEAAEADEQAVAEVRRDVLVSVSAEVALNYADLRALQSRARFARLNLSFQEATLTVVQSKVKAGAASQLDLSRAESQVSSTRAALPALNQQ
ncbi:MAG: multidrug efflux system outer membrane protein, partial [Planctomycetota bacterium]